MPRALPHLFTIILLLGMGAKGHAASVDVNDPSSIEAFFDIAFEIQKFDHELAGSTVVVVKDGKILFKKGYGFADIEKRVLVDPDRHLFRIASVSKPFTWTAIMQLVETGKLDLDTDIQTYLDFPIPETFDQPIKLKHLMTHSAGFEEMSAANFARSPEDVIPLADYLPSHMPARVRAPGTFISYSNYGSALAGYIVERVSGLPWADYIQLNVLDPLQMSETNVHQPMTEAHKNNHAIGYEYSQGKFNATDFWFEHEAPAGIISSTAANMANFIMFQLNQGQFKSNSILKPETTQKMHTELFRQHPQSAPVLHGFYRSDRNGLQIFGHGGDVNQFHSNLSLIPEHNLGIFVSYNSDPASQARSNVVPGFIDHFFPATFPDVQLPNPEVNLDDYIGSWTSTRRNHSSFEKISVLVNQQTIHADNGELVLSSGSSASRWTPVDEDHFRAKYSNRGLLFYRDKSGNATHFSSDAGFGAAEKLPWYLNESLHLFLFGLVVVVAAVYLARFVFLLVFVRGAPIILDQWTAAATASISLYLVYRIVAALTSSRDAFLYEVPASMELTLGMALTGLPLCFLLIVFNIKHWTMKKESLLFRLNYSLFTATNILFMMLLWFWNILGYYF